MELVLSTDLEKDNWVSGECTDSVVHEIRCVFHQIYLLCMILTCNGKKLSIGTIVPLSNRDIVILTVRIDLNSIRCCHSLRSMPLIHF